MPLIYLYTHHLLLCSRNTMERKFITVSGLKVSYLEQNPSAAITIFFFHGNSNSARLWSFQFSDHLLNEYRLIAVDFPGHGESSPIKTDDLCRYQVKAFGELMAGVVDSLSGNDPYFLAGLSLGSNVIAEMLNYSVHPKGLILLSPTIVGTGVAPNASIDEELVSTVLFTDNRDIALAKAYFHLASLSLDEHIEQLLLKDYLDSDPLFRTHLLQSAIDGMYSDEVSLLQVTKLPLLIIFGQEDRVISPEILNSIPFNLWQEKLFKLPHAAHLVNIDQGTCTDLLITNYIKSQLYR